MRSDLSDFILTAKALGCYSFLELQPYIMWLTFSQLQEGHSLRRVFMLLAAAACLLAAQPSMAQDMPKPLGISLGAGIEDAQKVIPNKLEEIGVNRYSNGPMFETSGDGLDIEGLSKVLLIFDDKNHLSVLQMTMSAGGIGKDGYDRVLGHLKAQYKLMSNQNPFVGDKKAVLETKGARIELAAPHMSFDMTVTYMTKDFSKIFVQASTEEQQKKKQTEGSRF